MSLKINFGRMVLSILSIWLLLSPSGQAMGAQHEPRLISPWAAKITPHGARLEVSQHADLVRRDNGLVLEFVIPAEAFNLSLMVPGHSISRWSSQPILLQPESAQASMRREMLQQKYNLSARISTLKSRLEVWGAQTQPASPQELSQRQELMGEKMPALARELNELEETLALVNRELAEFPGLTGMGQLIQVSLAQAPEKAQSLQINYSYDLANCGWQAVYDFNAHPDNGNGEMVDVRMMAEVWQFTGMDWVDTQITLATLGSGPTEPEPLRRWVVGAAPKPVPRPMKLNARESKATAHAETDDAAGSAPVALPVEADTDAVYATWSLPSKGLPEGRSRLQIIADAWRAPLQWLARPTTNDNQVWLLAKYKLPQNQAWPRGSAQYSVDGQSIGDGAFNPRNGEATLYFGSDPRVTVHTTVDTSREGETGFINTDKTWTGAWTYTVHNDHNKPIRVKVERPAPMIANENISVTYKDKPESIKDEKEHMVYWEVEVPGHGNSVIEHSITISSPQKLPLLPDVP